jgi:DNA-binding beta-propeller fold protein YncE
MHKAKITSQLTVCSRWNTRCVSRWCGTFFQVEAALRTLVASLVLIAAGTAALAVAPEGYTLLKTVPVPGTGGWDYLTVDEVGRSVYISHGTQVDVLDADKYELKGTIPNTEGVHGIAVAAALGRGFTSNGRANTVTVFDLKTLKPIGEPVKTGANPDCIIYDPATKRVFAFNGRGKNATVIDAAESKVLETIDLGGKPEFAAADGKGHVFVNIEDKNTVVKIDSDKMKVLDTWPLAPGEGPSAMAMDVKNNRLFVGCHNQKVVIVNAENGKVVGAQPIGTGVDAAGFDPETKLAFCSCGDGTTVIHCDGDDKYSVVETIKTKKGSKTMALDPKTHKLFLPCADFKDAAAGGRPTMDPKTFAVQVFGKSEK